MKIKKILVLNGPNLNMLGVREPEVYGNNSLASLEEGLVQYGQQRGIKVTCFQSNSEAKLINQIHKAPEKYDAIIFNPGAYTHYSYALRDAIQSVDTPVIEVHISDIDDREPFRKKSVTAPACVGQIKGLGLEGYALAIDLLLKMKKPVRLGDGYENYYPISNNIILGNDKARLFRANSLTAEDEDDDFEDDFEDDDFEEDEEDEVDEDFFIPINYEGDINKKMLEKRYLKDPQMMVEAQSQQPQQMTQPHEDARVPVQEPAFVSLRIPAIDSSKLSFERLNLLRLACARIGVGAMFIRDTPSIQWLTALDDVFDGERAHALLVAANLAMIHTDSRYANALQSEIDRNHVDVVVNDSKVSHAQFAFDILNPPDCEQFNANLGIEDMITYAEFVNLVELFTTEWLTPTTNITLNLRAVKGREELERIKIAQSITDAAFNYIVKFIKPGMSEREIKIELEHYLLTHGADDIAFSSIVATGENGADPHAVAGNARLEAGQCVVLDFGARVRGYCSDMTRTVFLGQPDETMMRAWQTLQQINSEVEAFLRPGITGKQAHELAESILTANGFEGKMGHGLGHGVGLEIHELPILSLHNEIPLMEGNVVTVEPGIYLPGSFGMRLEDLGVVTDKGFNVFTQSTHDMVII